MDRMIYLAMSGAKNVLKAQAAVTNNLANASTKGFRADFSAFRAMPVFGEGHPDRVYALAERPAIDFTQGAIVRTGNALDVAVDGEGWLAVQAPDGTEGYTRAGELHLTGNGQLVTASGLAVLGNGGPIAMPPAESLEIAPDGTISVRPLGQQANTLAQVDRIKLVNPGNERLEKGEDGLFRIAGEDGAVAPPEAAVRLGTGAVESSNVNSVEMLTAMISLQRQFELQVKAMRTANDNASAAAQLLRLG